MWKRERMMVDVISLQKAEEHSTCFQNSPLTPKMNTYTIESNNNANTSISTSSPPPQLQRLQNRHYYPFQGIHDTQTRFYPGDEYDVFGENPVNPCSITSNNDRGKRTLMMMTDDSNSGSNSKINRDNCSNNNIKKQKILSSPQEEPLNTAITSTTVAFSTNTATTTNIDSTIATCSSSSSNGYSFSSKPYDTMDSVMYYY